LLAIALGSRKDQKERLMKAPEKGREVKTPKKEEAKKEIPPAKQTTKPQGTQPTKR
jgi:hypothetical protein